MTWWRDRENAEPPRARPDTWCAPLSKSSMERRGSNSIHGSHQDQEGNPRDERNQPYLTGLASTACRSSLRISKARRQQREGMGRQSTTQARGWKRSRADERGWGSPSPLTGPIRDRQLPLGVWGAGQPSRPVSTTGVSCRPTVRPCVGVASDAV